MAKIEIGNEEFEVWPLSDADRTWYWMQIDDLAQKLLNPWLRLYEKVKAIPPNLQEVVFAGYRNTLLPITMQERIWICSRPVAVAWLFQLATNVSGQNIGDLSDLSAIDIWDDLVKALGESYTGVTREGQRLEGGQALGFLYQKMKDQAAAKEAEDDPNAGCPTRPMKIDPTPEDWPMDADRRMAEKEAEAKEAEGKTDGET